jgi:hypothetical protein
LIPLSIYVALAFWAFGLGGKPLDVGYLGIPGGTLSVQMLLLLLGLFAATLLIPFLVGTQRTRKRNLALQKEVRDYFGELEDILSAPTPSIYLEEIGGLRARIEAAKNTFIETDKLLVFARDTKQNPEKAGEADKVIAAGIEKTRDLDARFRFLDALDELEQEMNKVVVEIQKRPAETIEDAARHWSEKYKSRRDELNKTIQTAASSKPLILAGAGSLVSAIVLDLVSEVAKTGWDWIIHASK